MWKDRSRILLSCSDLLFFSQVCSDGCFPARSLAVCLCPPLPLQTEEKTGFFLLLNITLKVGCEFPASLSPSSGGLVFLGPTENEPGWKTETKIELWRTMNLICRDRRLVHSNESCFSAFPQDGSLNPGSLVQNMFTPFSHR